MSTDEKTYVHHGDTVLTVGEENTFFYTVTDILGIHARPAGALVKKAGEFQSRITVFANGKSAPADNIIGLMSLGAKKGTRLKIQAVGEDSAEALTAMETFLKETL